MDSASVWRVIIRRGVWFALGSILVLLGLILVLQSRTGLQSVSGTSYEATVTGKSVTNESGDVLCRLAVDPAGAPEESNAPTRIRSSSPCDELPGVGDTVQLTYVDDGRTVVATDLAAPSERPPLWLGVLLIAAGAATFVLFVRANRQFQRLLDEAGPESDGDAG